MWCMKKTPFFFPVPENILGIILTYFMYFSFHWLLVISRFPDSLSYHKKVERSSPEFTICIHTQKAHLVLLEHFRLSAIVERGCYPSLRLYVDCRDLQERKRLICIPIHRTELISSFASVFSTLMRF